MKERTKLKSIAKMLPGERQFSTVDEVLLAVRVRSLHRLRTVCSPEIWVPSLALGSLIGFAATMTDSPYPPGRKSVHDGVRDAHQDHLDTKLSGTSLSTVNTQPQKNSANIAEHKYAS